jgi:hypothetical protein
MDTTQFVKNKYESFFMVNHIMMIEMLINIDLNGWFYILISFFGYFLGHKLHV